MTSKQVWITATAIIIIISLTASNTVFGASETYSKPKIIATNAKGTPQTNFPATDPIYIQINPDTKLTTEVSIYIVTTPPSQDEILTDIRGTPTWLKITQNPQITLLWTPPLTPGNQYYLVLTSNKDAKFQPKNDYLSEAFSITTLEHFTLTNYPASTKASERFDGVIVTAYDTKGNIKTDYTGKIYFESSDEKAILPFTSDNPYEFSKSDAGVHKFEGFAFKTLGEQILIVTDTIVWEKSEPIKVEALSIPTALTVACSPTSVSSSGVMQTTINARLIFDSDANAGIHSQSITLSYFDGVAWNPITEMTTGATGSCSFNWDVPVTLPHGFYMIKATFNGNGGYEPSEAITNGSGGLFVLPEYTYGALVALLACFVALVAFKKGSILHGPEQATLQK